MRDVFDHFTGELLPPIVRPPWWRMSVKTESGTESMVQQHLEESANVNAIVARFRRTGEMPPARQAPVYADVTGLQGDFTDRINASRATMDALGAASERRKAEEAAKASAQPAAPPTASAEPPAGG